MQAQGLGGMGTSEPGEERVDVLSHLSGLQGELLKSRETGVELHNHTGTMNDIHDISGGPLVSLSSCRL